MVDMGKAGKIIDSFPSPIFRLMKNNQRFISDS
jgi:hypothetical protein